MDTKKEKEETKSEPVTKVKVPMIQHEHARILRKCLVSVMRKAPQLVVVKIDAALKEYSKAIAAYCECPYKALVEKEGKVACLDCGARHELPKPTSK